MKKNNILFIIIIILLILLIISLAIIYKNDYIGSKGQVLLNDNNTNDVNLSESNNINLYSAEENNVSTELTEKEKQNIEEYINIICNRGKYVRLPEFQNINNVDKKWIYSLIETREEEYYISKSQIENELAELFGTDLVVNVEEDTSSADGYFIPKYNSQKKKYEFLPIGGLITISYVIDSITKENTSYIVNVVEYSIQMDLDRNADEDEAVFAYSQKSENDWQNWKKVFEIDQEPINEIEEKVLNKKSEFQSYKITLEEVDGESIYVKNIEKI